jgi:hypothetical protein
MVKHCANVVFAHTTTSSANDIIKKGAECDKMFTQRSNMEQHVKAVPTTSSNGISAV